MKKLFYILNDHFFILLKELFMQNLKMVIQDVKEFLHQNRFGEIKHHCKFGNMK